ncbi:cysteine desulfurase [Tetragenococcus halophilus]|uniref:cysteine desulfurase n=1 Tax=Tetragenococcus halophilus TaxID=51669 RepID=A0A3G5FG08_TETHA|nr:cysteine desulfurase family protein [Tetragenococcus halophilus]MDN5810637.1 cysteine desulfurase [Tetragenococcus koreensis]AYW49165.1 cysteine desulfurase [Tetragenococcus halophilus]MCO8288200.1 cysteine desulfurase [Tetragenococcus halophilus]MDN5832113.1 cysteine desulfurase [Tetragenococcus halophilus]MDN6112524.1 cysteine desulfurase [Tetragenococcus halophilus]
MVYLDYNATTPVDETVFQAMLPFLKQEFGNPSNRYPIGNTAKQAVEKGREQVATLLNAKAAEITFTASGSESNNTVLKGVAYSYKNQGKHMITSEIEHPAILEPLTFLEKNGYEVTYVPVDKKGTVDPLDVKNAIREDTILVTIMHSNNEVGTLQPIEEIAEICQEKDVFFHTDASQSVGKVAIDLEKTKIDFLTVAGHKIYAPKGVGALFIREGIEIEPLIHGARQENGQRASTENVPYIAALGQAAVQAAHHLPNNDLKDIRDYFYEQLRKEFNDKIHLNGDQMNRLPNTLNVSFIGYNGAKILEDNPDVWAATGSACHTSSTVISPVLKAMGVDEKVALGAIRFSVGRYTTKEEIDETVALLKVYFTGENLINRYLHE